MPQHYAHLSDVGFKKAAEAESVLLVQDALTCAKKKLYFTSVNTPVIP